MGETSYTERHTAAYPDPNRAPPPEKKIWKKAILATVLTSVFVATALWVMNPFCSITAGFGIWYVWATLFGDQIFRAYCRFMDWMER